MRERMSLMIGANTRPSERDGESDGPSDSISHANELLDELEVTNMKNEIGLCVLVIKTSLLSYLFQLCNSFK